MIEVLVALVLVALVSSIGYQLTLDVSRYAVDSVQRTESKVNESQLLLALIRDIRIGYVVDWSESTESLTLLVPDSQFEYDPEVIWHLGRDVIERQAAMETMSWSTPISIDVRIEEHAALIDVISGTDVTGPRIILRGQYGY